MFFIIIQLALSFILAAQLSSNLLWEQEVQVEFPVASSQTMETPLETQMGNDMRPGSQLSNAPAARPQLQSDDAAQQAIDIAVADAEVATYLAEYPNWQAEAYPEEENLWGVDFYGASEEEWLGYVFLNIDTGEIIETYIPQQLSPEELQAGQAAVEKLVLNDAELLALLGDPNQWESETEYDSYDGAWYVWFGRGLDEWAVAVYAEDDRYYIEEIFDPAAWEAEEAEEAARNQAIELAYEAEGIDAALTAADDWRVYAENQGGSQWTVSFVAGEQELFFALVDTEQWLVLETSK